MEQNRKFRNRPTIHFDNSSRQKQQMVLDQLDSYMKKKTKPWPLVHTIQRINSKQITDLNVKAKT